MHKFLLLLLIFPFVCFSDDVDEFTKDLKKQNQELIEMSKTIQDAVKSGNYKDITSILNKGTGNKESNKQNIKKMSETILKVYQNKSEDELSSDLDLLFKTKPGYSYTKKGTKFNIFLTKLLRDKKAMPRFFTLAYKKDKLFKLGMFSLATIVLSILLKIMYRKKGFFKKYVFRFFLINGIRIGLIIYFIGFELSPSWQIFKRVYL